MKLHSPVIAIILCWNIISVHQQCASIRQCKCHKIQNQTLSADCSRLNLTTVPIFSFGVVVIDLSRNNFSILPSLTKLPEKVVSIDFSYNYISKFHNNAVFQKLSMLKDLNLEGNRLNLDYDTYPRGLFLGLKSMKRLNLKHNVNDPTGLYYPGETLSDLLSMETLFIDGLNNGTFGSEFLKLKSLNHLDISGLTGNCNIPYLTSPFFMHLPALRILNISKCGIFRIENGTFTNLKSLQRLDISFNEDLTFRVLSNVTYDLQFTDIKVLRANKIHRTFGSGTTIFTDDMRYLNNTFIEEIYLDINRLELFENGALKYIPPTLKYASFADNRFTMGLYVLEAVQLQGLKVLNGNFQYRSHNPSDAFIPPKNRSCDKLFRNKCDMTDHNYIETYENINIDVLFFQLALGIPFTIPFPKNLERIHFSKSGLQYSIPRMKFSNNSIKYVDFSKNVLNEWIGPIENIDSMNYLDLSYNYCANISTKFFMHAKNLKKLYANNNLLGFILNTDNGEIFQDLKRLTHLYLSQNRIQILQPSVFKGLSSVQQLDISNNLLRDWNFEFKHMKNLTHIDISGNQLTYLPENVINDLETLNKFHNLTLDLSGNSLMCSCETIDFLNWMKNTKIILKKKNNYKCRTSNKTDISLRDMNNAILELEIRCNSKIGLILGCSAAILISLTIIVCVIIYRYRWKIRYLYYMTRNKYRGYIPVGDKESDETFEFDAFVSYADEDRAFVIQYMVKQLETIRGLRLCIHHRDFVPGLDIAANITNSIHSSRKTIAVLSSHFLKSYWCQFEFNMARMETIYSRDGRDVLFLVFLRDVSAKDLPLMMMELIETQSYIEYPNDPQGDVVFWEKIKEALKQ